MFTGQRAVTAAGTPEKIKETPEFHKYKVISILIRANTGNAGNIFIVNTEDRASASTVGYILAAGETFILDVHDFLDGYLSLAEIWIDAGTSGDGISYAAFEVVI